MASKDIVLDYIIRSNDPVTTRSIGEDLKFNVNQHKISEYLLSLEDEGKIVEVTLCGNRVWVDTKKALLNRTIPERTVSAAVLICDKMNDTVLIAHPTGQLYWDLPKGRIDKDESSSSAAVRELHEETGIIISTDDLWVFPDKVTFNRYKSIDIWKYTGKELPDISKCICTSYFEDQYGVMRSEVDAFVWAPRSMISNYLPHELAFAVNPREKSLW